MHEQLLLAPTGRTDVIVRNRVSEIIQPYLRYLEGWHLRASYLTAQFVRHPRGSVGHALAEQRRYALCREIEASRARFAAETDGLPPDDRVDAAVDELDALVETLTPERRTGRTFEPEQSVT